MIIVRLIGGLGNQMFQYALGRRLSLDNKTELKLDISGFESYKLHKYSLKFFNIIENFATQEEIKELRGNNNRWVRRILGRLGYPKTYIREPYLHFAPQILNLTGNMYLEGYWGSEKYFLNIGPQIRSDFTLREQFNFLNKDLVNKIRECNSVSLHIRRADYVTNEVANSYHGPCSLEYYSRAVSQITKVVSNPVFFVFSDDLEWVKQNLRLNYPMVFTDNGPDKNYEDLTLMSICKHNIIANSTFSWWGAWLNSNPNKVVVYPTPWFDAPEANWKDIAPSFWVPANKL